MADQTINVQIDARKRKTLIFGLMMINFGFMLLSFGSHMAHPGRLAALGGMDYYAFLSVLNSFFMCIAVPVAASLGDRMGRKWLTVGAMILEVLVLIGAAVVPSTLLFLICWSIGGFATGCFLTAPFLIMSDVVEAQERPKYMGMMASVGAVGMLVGPLLAGVVADAGYLNLVYVLPAPFLVLALLMLIILYPNRKMQTQPRKFDTKGLLLLTICVGLIIFVFNFAGKLIAWTSPVTFVLLGLAIVFGILLVKVENKTEAPILAVHLLKRRNFRNGALMQLLFNSYTVATAGFVILFAQNVMQYSGTISGTVQMPQTIVYAIAPLFIGRWVAQNPARYKTAFTFGSAAASIMLFILSRIQPGNSIVWVYASMAIGGFAYSFMSTCVSPYAQRSLDRLSYGAGQGTLQFCTTGSTAIMASLYSVILGAAGADLQKGLSNVFLCGSLICLAMFVMILFAVKREDESAPQQSAASQQA